MMKGPVKNKDSQIYSLGEYPLAAESDLTKGRLDVGQKIYLRASELI
jgi:hypothetical protein